MQLGLLLCWLGLALLSHVTVLVLLAHPDDPADAMFSVLVLMFCLCSWPVATWLAIKESRRVHALEANWEVPTARVVRR